MKTPIALNIEEYFIDFFDTSGLAALIGGRAALVEGVGHIKVALLRVAGDLAVAEHRQVPMSHAVYDCESYPHLAKFHGLMGDVLILDDMPEAFRDWARRVASSGPPPGAAVLQYWLLWKALHGENLAHRHISRLVLFEALCISQRVVLHRAGGHIEVIDGQRSDVESIAEIELRELLASPRYAAEVFAVEDPWRLLMATATKTLNDHVEHLKAALGQVGADLRRELDRRQRFLDALHELPAADAVLLRNQFAGHVGEEKVTIEQLQVRHPAILGGTKRNTLDQRLRRLMERGLDVLSPRRPKSPRLIEVILDSIPERKR